MAAYVIAQMRVHDVDIYRRYALAVAKTVEPFGGRLLVASDTPHTLEGEQPSPRTVIGEFPSTEVARAWYESDAYAAIRPLRIAATTGSVFIVEGFSLPSAPHQQSAARGAS